MGKCSGKGAREVWSVGRILYNDYPFWFGVKYFLPPAYGRGRRDGGGDTTGASGQAALYIPDMWISRRRFDRRNFSRRHFLREKENHFGLDIYQNEENLGVGRNVFPGVVARCYGVELRLFVRKDRELGSGNNALRKWPIVGLSTPTKAERLKNKHAVMNLDRRYNLRVPRFRQTVF